MALRLKKIARYENRATNSVTERYSFKRSDGKKATIDLPPSLATDGHTFRALLLDGVTNEASDIRALNTEIAVATRAVAPVHYVYEDRTGWIPNDKAFVLQNGLVGKSMDNIVGIAPVANINRGKTLLLGTSKTWTRSIGILAMASTTMMLTTAIALCAPLLKVTKTESFGICLFGRTRGGKTLATLAAGSIIGVGKAEQLLNWYSTRAGLEPHFSGFNDCIFPIDDLSKLPVRTERERFLEVHNLGYQTIDGDIKGRHPSFDSATRTNAAHYRFIVLTSFEKSIRDLAHEANQARSGGETIRLIDVPAYFDGLNHIVDRVHARPTLSQEGVQKFFSEVRSACAENHGRVYRRYLKHLISQRQTLEKTTLKYQRFFIKGVTTGDSTDAADLARKFGLIYAGGRMGIDAKILPWKKADLFDAIKKCYDAANTLMLGDKVLLEQGRNALRAYLRSLPTLTKFKRLVAADVSGFVDEQDTHFRCVVKTEAFSQVFASRHQQRLVMAALTREGKVTLATPRGNAQPAPQSQFMWPNGKRVRSFEIKWPFKTDKAT
jgi:Domain of unknown function (DUF927)